MPPAGGQPPPVQLWHLRWRRRRRPRPSLLPVEAEAPFPAVPRAVLELGASQYAWWTPRKPGEKLFVLAIQPQYTKKKIRIYFEYLWVGNFIRQTCWAKCFPDHIQTWHVSGFMSKIMCHQRKGHTQIPFLSNDLAASLTSSRETFHCIS